MEEPTQQTSQNGVESNNVTIHKSTSKSKEERTKHKKKKKKSSSRNNRKPKPPPKDKGTTVSKFMKKQQTLQNEATHQQYTKRNNQMIQHGQIVSEDQYYFDTDSDNDDDGKKNGGALVPHSQQQQQQSSSQQSNQIVDTLPADHPSSSQIQTHRTCTICQRTLPRSQFSERDRYTINYSLSPGGVTCRTCTLTICAVKLKSIPSTEELLLEYAQKGVRDGLLALEQQQQGGNNVAGYLEGMNHNENALVLRKNSQVSGNELMLYGGGRHTPPSPMDSTTMIPPPNHSTNNINAPFSGRQYAHTDLDRPSSNIAPSKYIDTLLQLPCYLNLNAYGIYKNCEDISISMSVLECVRLYGTLNQYYFRAHDCDGLLVDGNEVKKDMPTPPAAATAAAVNPKSVVCIVLGEGSTPRTAILASQHYGWTTIAIDPTLSSDWEGYHEDIPNFTGYNTSISDFMSNESSDQVTEVLHHRIIDHLVIIAIQHTKDTVRLKGTGHINEIRDRYNDVPTTLVSISPIRKVTLAPTNRRNGQCGSKLEKDVGYEPNCSYIDENVFSEVRQIDMWNFHNADDDDVDSGEDEEEYNVGKGLGRSSISAQVDKADDTAVRPLVVNVDERKKPIKKNAWLEDKVAQHKKSQQGHVEARERGETMAEQQQEEEEQVFAGDASAQSLGTLSTKETLERRVSCDMVDKPGGVSSKASPTMEGIDERTNEQQPNVVDGVWSNPPNEDEATNDVWEKAMRKHSEQEEEELNNQSGEEYDEDDDEEQDEQDWKANQGLPPNWEAIFDPSSGEYYYNNWDTNEVTWDRPAPLDAQAGNQAKQVPMSPLDDQGVEDHQPEDSTQPVNQEVNDNQGAADDKVAKNQQMESQSDFYQSDTSNYVFGHDDDQSSISSGIAGLTACAVPPALENSADEDDEDNLQWSDNEEEKDQFDDSPRTSLQRTESTTSQKSKPWHKKDSTSVNNDSFMSY